MEHRCPHDSVLDPIRGKWKAEIVYILSDRPRRLSEIERILPGAIQRVLKRQLRGLEKDGIVQRKIYSKVPPKVEYSLTERGIFLYSLVYAMNQAAEEYMHKFKDGQNGQTGVGRQ